MHAFANGARRSGLCGSLRTRPARRRCGLGGVRKCQRTGESKVPRMLQSEHRRLVTRVAQSTREPRPNFPAATKAVWAARQDADVLGDPIRKALRPFHRRKATAISGRSIAWPRRRGDPAARACRRNAGARACERAPRDPQHAGYKRAFCTEIIEAFVASLTTELRQRAKRQLGLSSVSKAHAGLVTFVQRSDGALRLNVHLHTLALDGVYVRNTGGKLEFHALARPL